MAISSNEEESVPQQQTMQSNGGNCFSDPLFLASSDNSTTPLVSVLFNGDNYIGWCKNVKRALGAKNKLGFIEGFVKKPEVTDSNYHRWIRCDYMVIGWILSSMKPDISENFNLVNSAECLWSDIQERFGQSNGPQVYQLKKELDGLRQQNLTILTYYNKMKNLWDKLKELRSFPECSCGVLKNCSCSFLKRLAEFESQEKVMQFLLGLNSGFDNTITNVLSTDPMPSINRTFSILQQVEKQKEISGMADVTTEVSALAAHKFQKSQPSSSTTGGKRDWKKEKMDRYCDYCKNKGHTKDQCFKLIGYPDWYPKNSKNGVKMAANVEYETGILESPLEEDDGGGQNEANLVNAICQEVLRALKGKQSMGSHSAAFANSAGMDPNCLTSCNLVYGDNWIVDSGATDHMTHNAKLFKTSKTLKIPIPVCLPDGTYKYVKVLGEIVLHNGLVLKDVMLIEDFKHRPYY
ncbi:uncharacterized protein [Spinacia oleracea]|uniref:Retrotransposon Copia-like N-terminal domain-containing protein n=1 Tax=Spinacia oleracea TaxID=3562 RepID=A0ABM3RR39_SPIOL|nr:uncharacterized protein LOC130459083 [Spinacia oleracea]